MQQPDPQMQAAYAQQQQQMQNNDLYFVAGIGFPLREQPMETLEAATMLRRAAQTLADTPFTHTHIDRPALGMTIVVWNTNWPATPTDGLRYLSNNERLGREAVQLSDGSVVEVEYAIAGEGYLPPAANADPQSEETAEQLSQTRLLRYRQRWRLSKGGFLPLNIVYWGKAEESQNAPPIPPNWNNQIVRRYPLPQSPTGSQFPVRQMRDQMIAAQQQQAMLQQMNAQHQQQQQQQYAGQRPQVHPAHTNPQYQNMQNMQNIQQQQIDAQKSNANAALMAQRLAQQRPPPPPVPSVQIRSAAPQAAQSRDSAAKINVSRGHSVPMAVDYDFKQGDPMDQTSRVDLAWLRYQTGHLHMNDIMDSWTLRDLLEEEESESQPVEEKKEQLRVRLEALKKENAEISAKIKSIGQ